MAITRIELRSVAMAEPQILEICHRHKVRAELASLRRGWPKTIDAPLAGITLAAHFAMLERDQSTPKDFDQWMDSIDEFEFIEEVESTPFHKDRDAV